MRRSVHRGARGVRFAVTAATLVGLLALGPATARSAQRAQVTVTFLTYASGQASYEALIEIRRAP